MTSKSLDEILITKCDPMMHAQTLGAALKCAGNLKNIRLVEHVWEWGKPIRDFRLSGKRGNGGDIAFVDAQYVTLCGELGQIECARAAWNEWENSITRCGFPERRANVLRAAFVSALAMHGHLTEATFLYKQRFLGDKNNQKMTTSIIAALSRAGLYKNAVSLLQNIKKECTKAQKPLSVQIYNAVVDACARAGNFVLALEIGEQIKMNDVAPNEITWMSILGSCRTYANVHIAKLAFEQIKKTNQISKCKSALLLLADIYEAVGCQEEAERLFENFKEISNSQVTHAASHVVVGPHLHIKIFFLTQSKSPKKRKNHTIFCLSLLVFFFVKSRTTIKDLVGNCCSSNRTGNSISSIWSLLLLLLLSRSRICSIEVNIPLSL